MVTPFPQHQLSTQHYRQHPHSALLRLTVINQHININDATVTSYNHAHTQTHTHLFDSVCVCVCVCVSVCVCVCVCVNFYLSFHTLYKIWVCFFFFLVNFLLFFAPIVWCQDKMEGRTDNYATPASKVTWSDLTVIIAVHCLCLFTLFFFILDLFSCLSIFSLKIL